MKHKLVMRHAILIIFCHSKNSFYGALILGKQALLKLLVVTVDNQPQVGQEHCKQTWPLRFQNDRQEHKQDHITE
jgi:hypothetical protein